MDSPAAGILLIADPFLKDPNFLRTIIFLCEHKNEGSFGFVLNRQLKYVRIARNVPARASYRY